MLIVCRMLEAVQRQGRVLGLEGRVLSVANADKAAAPESYADRLVMMSIFAEELEPHFMQDSILPEFIHIGLSRIARAYAPESYNCKPSKCYRYMREK